MSAKKTLVIGAAGALAMLAATERRRTEPLEMRLDDPAALLPQIDRMGRTDIPRTNASKERSKAKAARKQSKRDRRKK